MYALTLRVGLFAFLEILGLIVFGWALSPGAGTVASAALSTFLAAVLTNAFTVRIFERLSLAQLGLHWNACSARNLLWGLGGGVLAGLVVLVPPILAGVAKLTPAPDQPANLRSLLFVSAMLALGVVGEELLFRGYGFQLLLRHAGPFATILPVSALFAAAHAANLNATPLALLNTFLWGGILGFAVLRSGDLWLPIGLHFGWNWTLPLFGVNLSGFRMSVSGYVLDWKLGPLWSGGDYGPEGSLLTLLMMPLLTWALWRAPMETQRLPLVSEPEQPSEPPNEPQL
ncbi:MAG: CPBP family intramembrane metalloprotease [Bryobacteraceae bacterium]|nr:CPBP family intramembrane metalloprotease [Bryobacteraceae bacterium]